MKIKICSSSEALGRAAAELAVVALRDSLAVQGSARIIAATGTSQLGFLKALIAAPRIDWQRIELFHLDEYIGLPITHKASFRNYLLDRFIQPAGIRKYHLLDAEKDPAATCERVGAELNQRAVDLAFVGIGENGHLAFNDPPADFHSEHPFLIVELDESCRRQQVGEGWFRELSEVPRQAITMSVRQILKSKTILAIVPEKRKAQAVRTCVEGEISPLAPASILRRHPDVKLFLDEDSASLLSAQTLANADQT